MTRRAVTKFNAEKQVRLVRAAMAGLVARLKADGIAADTIAAALVDVADEVRSGPRS